jgi:hypothetical protein
MTIKLWGYHLARMAWLELKNLISFVNMALRLNELMSARILYYLNSDRPDSPSLSFSGIIPIAMPNINQKIKINIWFILKVFQTIGSLSD